MMQVVNLTPSPATGKQGLSAGIRLAQHSKAAKPHSQDSKPRRGCLQNLRASPGCYTIPKIVHLQLLKGKKASHSASLHGFLAPVGIHFPAPQLRASPLPPAPHRKRFGWNIKIWALAFKTSPSPTFSLHTSYSRHGKQIHPILLEHWAPFRRQSQPHPLEVSWGVLVPEQPGRHLCSGCSGLRLAAPVNSTSLCNLQVMLHSGTRGR